MATAEEWVQEAGDELIENEDAVFALILSFMVKALYDISQELIRKLPDEGDLTRELVYADIRNDLLLKLGEFNDELAAAIAEELEASQVEMRELADDYQRGPTDQPLQSGQQLMETITAWGLPLSVLFFRRDANSASQWMRQLMKLIEKKVRGGMFKQQTTSEIADEVTPGASSNNPKKVVIAKGSVLNNVRSRTKGIISNAIWSGFTLQQGKVWSTHDGPFIWDAILDKVTCQRCRALDGQIRPRRSDFDPLPQLHDWCRCVVRPTRQRNQQSSGQSSGSNAS